MNRQPASQALIGRRRNIRIAAPGGTMVETGETRRSYHHVDRTFDAGFFTT